jgi:hypothetical protein
VSFLSCFASSSRGGGRSGDDFEVAHWQHFFKNEFVEAIKAGSPARLNKAIAEKAKGAVLRREFVEKYRLPHTGASLLHIAILYGKFEEIAKPLVAEFGEPLVGGCYRVRFDANHTCAPYSHGGQITNPNPNPAPPKP